MEESDDEQRVVPELYFLIAKFLSGGPLKETAKTLLDELERVEVLPRRLDWLGQEHAQSYDELQSQYENLPWRRLADVCARALQLSRGAASATDTAAPAAALTQTSASASAPALAPAIDPLLRLNARLSLLSESLLRDKPKYASFKQDHSIVRRLFARELNLGKAGLEGGRPDLGLFPARLLSGLQLQRRTLGHLSSVYCLVFDCTGRYVITGADDLLVKVWSANDGRLLTTLRGAAAEITDACVSWDGALLACGSVERLVRVWCLATGAPRAVLHAHMGTITSVHWAPPAQADVRWLASTSTDGSVAFWTCSPDGQFLSQPVQYVERMRPGACHMICAAWSAGGAFLAAGSADHHVRVYCVEGAASGGPRRILETAVHGDAVDSIAWAHRGLRFVSGSKDGTAALWVFAATQWRHSLLRCGPADAGQRLKVTMVCWDCSDAYVLTAVSDHTIRVWCSRTCQQVRTLRGHRDEAYVLEAHPLLPGVLLSAGHDGQLFVWHAPQGEVLARFHNHIEGQGDGAIFDAKWGASGAQIAASDSHGHLLLLGLGAGHRLLRELPTELFFHTDYRPCVRDALGGALDEQTETPPHLMPPPFLVDVEGAPHPPELQRLVPGRENLTLSQLIPVAEAARSRLDVMIEALAAERSPRGAGGGGAGGVWRGEGVRHTAGSWQRGDPLDVPHATRPILQPLSRAARERVERSSAAMYSWEQSWYRREMRRRPLMISTAAPGSEHAGPRRRAGRRPAPRPRPAPPPPRTLPRLSEEFPEESGTDDHTSDESVRLSGEARSSRASRSSRSSRSSADDLSDSSSSPSGSRSDNSSSSQYSDWEAGAALAPPARARRRPIAAKRYSPNTTPTKRPERAAAEAGPSSAPVPHAGPSSAPVGPGPGAGPVLELPEAYRPGEWLTAVSPRKAPYHPQIGDHCLYFRVGHQRYFEAVSEKDIYKVNPRDKPWERTQVNECEPVKVVGIKYVIKPPRVVCLKLASTLAPRSFTVRYHDMPDVIDFLVLRQQYAAAMARQWKRGDRFRCMIDDSWWSGCVLESSAPPGAECPAEGPPGGAGDPAAAARWAAAAAGQFLALRVRWDNGEMERLSPWDLEPLDPARVPSSPGGAVPVLAGELEAALYRAEPHEWPPRGDRATACRHIAQHIGQVMSLSVAEPFVAPVDLQLYPAYAMTIPYPIDLSSIKARFENLFYRRAAAAQFDVRYLASNAEQFNESHSPIVRQARLVTDLLLHIISHWREVDVVAKYHELAASYHSSDDEPLSAAASNKGAVGGAAWRARCSSLLRELCASADAEPFREPVQPDQAPGYLAVVRRPMDLGTVRRRLAAGRYADAEQLARDVRRVFANSRLYNTNKRSRIYSMTVRLSALFEALWARLPVPRTPRAAHAARPHPRPRRGREGLRRRRGRGGAPKENGEATVNGFSSRAGPAPSRVPPTPSPPAGRGRLSSCSDSSDSETLAATSRRVHGTRGQGGGGGGSGGGDSWDSDEPLNTHRKGKGIGKKSKNRRNSDEPGPSTSAAVRHTYERAAAAAAAANGLPTDSEEDGSARGDDDDMEWRAAYVPRRSSAERRRRKRRRGTASSSSSGPSARPKRTRERFVSASSTASSSGASGAGGGGGGGGGGSPRRYESDRSYRPRYSTDDDAPLHLYRQRQSEPEDSASASASAGGSGSRVSLRARRSPRRYNEDSEEDSPAAISKRLHGRDAISRRRLHPRAHAHPHQHAHPHHAQGAGAAGAGASSHTRDHNYFNGAASTHNGRRAAEAGPVSISSRGRVRRLTAKARGLLRE